MFTLLYVFSAPAMMGVYADLPSCQNAIQMIYAQRINPYKNTDPKIAEAIDMAVKTQTQYVCVPNKK